MRLGLCLLLPAVALAQIQQISSLPFGPTALAIDNSGNIYVAGGGYLAKYSPDGQNMLWRAFLDSGSTRTSVASIAVGKAGEIAVAGFLPGIN